MTFDACKCVFIPLEGSSAEENILIWHPAEEGSCRPIRMQVILALTNLGSRCMGSQWRRFLWWGGGNVCVLGGKCVVWGAKTWGREGCTLTRWDRGVSRRASQSCAALRSENMVVVRCVVLALCSIASAACADPRETRTAPGAGRRQRADSGGDAERRRSVSTRSAGVNEQTCPASPEVDATLREDTHSVSGGSRRLLPLLPLLLLLLSLFIRSQQRGKGPPRAEWGDAVAPAVSAHGAAFNVSTVNISKTRS